MSLFDLDAWQELAGTLRTNKLRTALTAAGVFWGMVMLLLMLGFGEGLEIATHRTVGRWATNAVYIWRGSTTLPYRGFKPGRSIRYDNDDVGALRVLPGVRLVAPRTQLGGWRDGTPVRRGPEAGGFQVMGDTPDYDAIQTVVFDAGRFVNQLDVRDKRKVAVIGSQVVEVLFPDWPTHPVGEWIHIRGVAFQVVGVFHSADSSDRGDRTEGSIHVPLSTFQQAFNTGPRIHWFAILGDPGVKAGEVERRVKAALADRHDVHPDDLDAMGSYNAEEEFERIQSLFIGIEAFVWLVGLATLLSGVVGVSNIMLIVVRERTREIGLRRAIGATPRDIVTLILQEAAVLTAVAGYAGIVAGVAIIQLAAWGIGPNNETIGQPGVDLTAALGAGAVLLVAGLLAGVLPAQRALAIEPVTALRAE